MIQAQTVSFTVNSLESNRQTAGRGNLLPLLILVLFASIGHNLAAPSRLSRFRKLAFRTIHCLCLSEGSRMDGHCSLYCGIWEARFI